MKTLSYFLIFCTVIFLVGCQCPQKRKEEKIKEYKEGKEAPKIEEIVKKLERPAEEPKIEETKKEETEEVPGAKEEVSVTELPPGAKIIKPEEKLAEIFQNIYFDFDKYDLRQDAIERLKIIGEYMRKNPDIKILIEGHCDERGTREYNLILGEQRALSARNFLINYGISPKRLYTVSYGEDKPADPGHNEQAWAKNRRCEFKIVK